MKDLTICNTTISQDSSGRYCLNDLHRAAGGEKRHQPSDWFRLSQTQDLIEEVRKSGSDTDAVRTAEGRNGGTFVVKELVYAYAMWISVPFISHVLRAFSESSSALSDAAAVLRALQDFEVPDDLPDMFVYAIREVDTGNIKLGISRDPARRLRQLQIGNSSRLQLVTTRRAENRFADERALHADASEYQIQGEWFEPTALTFMR